MPPNTHPQRHGRSCAAVLVLALALSAGIGGNAWSNQGSSPEAETAQGTLFAVTGNPPVPDGEGGWIEGPPVTELFVATDDGALEVPP